MPYKDLEKAKANRRKYYLEVSQFRQKTEQQKALTRKADNKRRANRKLQAIELKGGVCADCKKSYHPACFDFHHLDPKEKDFNPCSGLSKKLEVFLSELDKCIMLCANCHRIRHSLYDTTE